MKGTALTSASCATKSFMTGSSRGLRIRAVLIRAMWKLLPLTRLSLYPDSPSGLY